MTAESKKITLIITLTVIALLINMEEVLGFILAKYEAADSYHHFLYEIRFVFWGWLPIFIFAAAAIGATLYWKPGSSLFRGLIIFFSIIAIIYRMAWLWMLIAMLSMKP